MKEQTSAIGLQTADHPHVTVNEHVPSDRFNRYVDEQIQEWLRDHDVSDENHDYEVAFFDEDPLGEVSCLVVVRANDHLWRSWESADNPQRALCRSLERLHEDLENASSDTSDNSSSEVTH